MVALVFIISFWIHTMVLKFISRLLCRNIYNVLRMLLIVQRILSAFMWIPFLIFFYCLERLGFHYITVVFFKLWIKSLLFFSGYALKDSHKLKGISLILCDSAVMNWLCFSYSSYKSVVLKQHAFFKSFLFKRFILRLGFLPIPSQTKQSSLSEDLNFVKQYSENGFDLMQIQPHFMRKMPAIVFVAFLQQLPLNIYSLNKTRSYQTTTIFSPNKHSLSLLSTIQPHKRLALFTQNVESVLEQERSKRID